MKNKKAYITDNGLNCKIIKAAEKLDELIKKGMIRSDRSDKLDKFIEHGLDKDIVEYWKCSNK